MKQDNNLLARITPATRILQTLSQRGKIKEEYITNAQKVLDEGKNVYSHHIDDFSQSHIQVIKKYISEIRKQNYSPEIIENISSSIANFRANISILGRNDYLDICSVILNWIESINKIDLDVCDILNVYIISIEKFFNADHVSNEEIISITNEINEACGRYFLKHSDIKPTRNINNSQVLYISNSHLGFNIDETSFLDEMDIED